MIPKTLFEPHAEKFALFKTSNGSFYLRAPRVAYHNNIMEKFEKEISGQSLQIIEGGGAKFYKDKNTVTLYDFSAAWGRFPVHLKEPLIALFQEAFPGKKIVDRLD